MRGGGSVRGRSDNVSSGGVDDGIRLKAICWNVSGWARGDGMIGGDRVVESQDIRAKVLDFFQPDIVCLTETWLRGIETAGFDGYMWFGHNRASVSKNVARGSGGAGVLVKESILCDWLVDVIDRQLKDVMWVRLEHRETHMQYSLQCATFLRLVPVEKLTQKSVFKSWKRRLTTSKWRVRWLCVVTLTQGVVGCVIEVESSRYCVDIWKRKAKVNCWSIV